MLSASLNGFQGTRRSPNRSEFHPPHGVSRYETILECANQVDRCSSVSTTSHVPPSVVVQFIIGTGVELTPVDVPFGESTLRRSLEGGEKESTSSSDTLFR